MSTAELSKKRVDNNMFANRELAIATMHGKEQVIAPLLEREFSIKCTVPNINTDALGTFSGEIERTLSPIEAARKKCELAMELSGTDLAIASEGSFGNHPVYGFVHGNEEIVLLLDKKNEIEIIGKELSTKTNMSGSIVRNLGEALEFCKKVGFPDHALIIRKDENSTEIFHKGLSKPEDLQLHLEDLFRSNDYLWLETDMRANFNPTRMEAIARATQNLIVKLNSQCPSCNFPGYWITSLNTGLPCSACGTPSRSTLSYIYSCVNCDHTSIKKFPHNKESEDPMYCDICNP